MHPLNDENLDRISREAADQFEIEPGASGWERLEKRLTQELPEQKKDRRRFLFWLFFIVIGTGGGLTWMLGNSNKAYKIKQNTVTASTTTNPTDEEVSRAGNTPQAGDARQHGPEEQANRAVTPGRNTAPASGTTAASGITASEEKIVPAPQKQPVTNEKQTVNIQDGISRKQDISKKQIAGNRVQKDRRNSFTPASTPKNSLKNRQVKEASGQIPPVNSIARGITDPEKQDKPVADPQDAVPVPNTITDAIVIDKPAVTADSAAQQQTPDSAMVSTDSAISQAAEKTAVPKKKAKVTAPLEIGLVAGPDFTYVKFNESYKTGYNVGLQIGYRLSNRWALNTGLFYTKKNYAAKGEDFHPPKHTPISYLDLDQVKGNCSMFEIPLNVRYDFSVKKQNRLFASTGVTSYIMTDQYYDYYYYDQNNIYQKKYWGTDSTSRYFLSVVNLSVGYERQIGKQFSLQAEPYLKLPLKGLGFGSMRMESFGLYLSVKYKPFLRK
jgi:hypothetical protein